MGRHSNARNQAPVLFNRNAGNPDVWTFEPDTSRDPIANDLDIYNFNTRLTWQAQPKLRIGFTADILKNCDCPRNMVGGDVPEGEVNNYADINPKNQIAGDFSMPLTSQYLLEGNILQHHSFTPRPRLNPNLNGYTGRDLVSVQEQTNRMLYRADARASENVNDTMFTRFALSRVTGSHSLKVGVQYSTGSQDQERFAPDAPTEYRFRRGVPNRITLYAEDTHSIYEIAEHALFVQDRWTVNRLTVTGGLRYEYFHVNFPAVTIGPSLHAPNRNISFPVSDGVTWHDLSPRFGLAVDLTGDGRTALKVSAGRYIHGQLANRVTDINAGGLFTVGSTPASRVVTRTRRSWRDRDGDFVPDCDLLNPARNGECGAFSDPAFGTARVARNFDPDVLTGWGKSPYNWQLSVGVQRELAPGVSVDASYFRTTFGNRLAVDNRAVAPSDFDEFSITAPVDPRLPGGGGYTIGPLYDLVAPQGSWTVV